MNQEQKLNFRRPVFIFFLCLCLSFVVSPALFAQWTTGSGISGDPYRITNLNELIALQTGVNTGTNYSGKYFRLMVNLDLSGTAWIPIGSSTKPFKGNFDGNGKKINGLYINQPSINDVGLFGYLSAATISNLGVSTVSEGIKGGTNVGILAGSQSGGSISNCYVMGTVAGTDQIGGLVGNQPNNVPAIKQCFAFVNITGSGGVNGIGGLIGVLRGTLSDSYAWGNVEGGSAIGGLIGTISSSGVVTSCYTAGNITSTSPAKAGGITGSISQLTSKLKNSVALNTLVIGNNSSFTGRVVGYKQYSDPGITENNYATNDMSILIIKDPKTITPDINGYDGGTQNTNTLKTQSFYATTVAWSIASVNDNSKNWNIWENINLPYLQTQSSPVNNVSSSGTSLQGVFRTDVTMDSILIYTKIGTSFIQIGTANVNNTSHTWTFSNPALEMNGILYIIAYESGKIWPSYPVIYTICALPLMFDVIDGETNTSALNLTNCVKNLQNTTIDEIQFSKTGDSTFDANIIPSPTTYSVDGTQTIYARVKNKFGCQSEIKSFQVKQIRTLLFKEDFGSGSGCSEKSLGNGITTYQFGGDLHTNGNYGICSQLSNYYKDYFYYAEASYDHTDPGKGRSLIVNANYDPGQFYQLKISNICPGTHLYFSAWVFNLVNPNADQTASYTKQGTVFNDPDLHFILTDGADGTILKEYKTGSIPKVTDPATNWRPYGFDFITGSSSTVILTLKNNAPGGNGNDLMIDDIEVYGSISPVMIDGPLSYCPGDPLNLTIKDMNKMPLTEDVKVNWLFSENGSMGFDAKWDTISNLTSVHLDMPFQKSGYLRAVVGHPIAIDEKLFNCCSMSDPTYITITPNLMYWSKTSKNNDWNNPDNWVDANDVPLNNIPGKCTDVHIPGNAQYYPSLENENTLRSEFYGEPRCRDITYHFGSEVAKPHYLDYRKAYIQYNFGYYNESNYILNGDPYSAAPMERGHWYALAAPLKNIVSSDFSVGGFPNFWQRGFKSSIDRFSTLNGDWYIPENTAALEIGARQNYAISIWAGELLPGVLGEDNHQNLNALNGILQMPYFEDAVISANHRIHEYNTADSTSRFYYYYYDRIGLPVKKSFYDSFRRGGQSYRFVFEDNNNEARNDFAVNVPAGTEIMIGNPFISSLDFNNLYERNNAVMENYYRLFEKDKFITYSIPDGSSDGLTNDIASFQGFFIKTKGTGTTTLYFPKSSSVTRPAFTLHKLRSFLPENEKIYINADNKNGSGRAMIVINNATLNPDIPQLFIISKESENVPQIYTLNSAKKKNVIQHEQGEQIEVPIGIKCESNDTINFSFSNIGSMNYESFTLTDTRLNKTINLLNQNTYSFKNEPNAGERFLLRIGGSKDATAIDPAINKTVFQASFYENMLQIQSSEIISMVSIFSIQGIKISSWSNINAKNFSKEVQLPDGMYIADIKLINGETKNKKIIIIN